MMKKIIKNIFNSKIIIKLFEVLSERKSFVKLPMGVDFKVDLDYHLPKYDMKIIFDVGANNGQTAKKYNSDFKYAKIYSFEPHRSTFEKLIKNTSAKKNITCHNIAFGNKNGNEKIHISDDGSVFNRIINSENLTNNNSLEEINIRKLEDFVDEYFQNEPIINLLKIDTEGYDLEVLKGSERLISNQKIDFIEVETSMNKTNKDHILWSEFVDFFRKYEYYIFGLYEQTLDFKLKKPIQRRSNVIFISPKVYNQIF